jgi:hypothetical protein
MCGDGFFQERNHRPLLQTQASHDGQDAFHKAAALGTMTSQPTRYDNTAVKRGPTLWARISAGMLARVTSPQQRTGARLTLVFGNLSRQDRQFRYLMARGRRVVGASVARQGRLAVGTRGGHIGHRVVDLFGRQPLFQMGRMPWLATRTTRSRLPQLRLHRC